MSEKRIIAFCGISCSDCPAFKATVANDDDLRRDVAEKWSSDEYPINAKDVNCLGCIDIDNPVMSFVGKCRVRLCAAEKGVETCASCEDYACEVLQGVWDYIGDNEAKENLEAIRKNRE
jgi:hypothetical protein